MLVKKYKPTEIISKTVGFMGDTISLTKLDSALSVLPADTQFAIVIEAIERNVGESFIELDVTTVPLAAAANVGGAGLEGRFIGYLALDKDSLRIYKEGQAIFEDKISSIKVAMNQGQFVISGTSKMYKIVNAYQIKDADSHFESKVIGFNQGLNPLLDKLQTAGAQVKRPSSKANLIFLVIFLAVIAALSALIIIKGHH